VLKVQDSDLPIYNVRTMEEHLRSSIFALMPMRMGATLAGIQGLIGLLLALMGLYSVVAYSVGQRTQEIGIRMALGAQPSAVLRLVVRDGMRLTCIGISLGLGGASAVNYLLSKALYGIKPLDWIVFLAVTCLLLSVAGLACYWPARRAIQIDPMKALRCE
jgi:putative ABC transport system permease protein